MSGRKYHERQLYQQKPHSETAVPSSHLITANNGSSQPTYPITNTCHQYEDTTDHQDCYLNNSSYILDERTLYSHPHQPSSAITKSSSTFNTNSLEPMFHEKIDEKNFSNPTNIESSPTLYDIESQPYNSKYIVQQQPAPTKGSNRKPPFPRRNRCLRCLCCACCFPPWLAYSIWTIIIAIIIIIVIFICLLATFKIPDINLAGINTTNLPEGKKLLQFTSTDVIINAGLVINVKNPNVLGLKISDIRAKAYWPMENGNKFQIGKGFLKYQDIPKNSDINFTYPFEIDYDLFDKEASSLLNEFSRKCGLTGEEPSNIDITYDLNLAAQVLFVKIHPTISSAASFVCPLQNSQFSSSSGKSADSSTSSDDDEISSILSSFVQKIPNLDIDSSSATFNNSTTQKGLDNDLTTMTTILTSLNTTSIQSTTPIA
ncbi:hypothetical protein BDF20DRAFT_991245 [Mycotypha africana]|uniref:uncharacterized protein n=1 Tax=Mycotypha africana TaxID=64632 RepID=UPI002301101A|nr:uncharacterized protein BDF20DRAFT_991245 [Mycotypha africana]KAI8968292.1 hypothetical protein BDF20DRAFT_991245 [Mycotypha africana]